MGDEDEFRCFVGNLSWSTSDRSLKQAFEKYGNIVDAKVVLDKFSGRSRGFGFVTFENEKDMEEAIEAMNDIDLDGRSINVDKCRPNQGSGRDRDGDRDRGRDRDRSSNRDYDGGRGSGGSDCFKCGKPGHFARECLSGEESRGGRYGGRDDRHGDGGCYGSRNDDRHGGGGSRYGSDRDDDRYGGRSRDSGSRGSSGNDKYCRDRDRSGPYERSSGGHRS